MNVVIVGAGGFGREVLSLIKAMNVFENRFNVLGFIDDALEKGVLVHDLPVLGNVEDVASLQVKNVVVAVGNPLVRKSIVEKLGSQISFPILIHPSVIFQDLARTKIGDGAIICAGNIFTTDITLGNHCIINLSCTIGHDAELGDFSSIMPGVNISGGAKLKSCVYVGTGAKLIKASQIGEKATIGAGAVVDTDVLKGETVVGVPARPLNKRHEL